MEIYKKVIGTNVHVVNYIQHDKGYGRIKKLVIIIKQMMKNC